MHSITQTSRSATGLFTAALVVIGVLVTACGPTPPADPPEPSAQAEPAQTAPAPQPEPEPQDVLARAACRHWRNITSDLTAGLYTDAELREKVKEVYGDAQYADDPAIVAHAEGLLRSVTLQDVDEFGEQWTAFSTACMEGGHLAA